MSDSVTLWTIDHQAPLSMGFSRYEYWSGLPCPAPGDLPDPGVKPMTPVSSALAGRFFTTNTPYKNQGRCFLVLAIEETGSVSNHSSGFPFPPLCVFLYPHYQHKGLSEIIWLTNGPIINNIDPSYITHLLHINDTEWVPLRALLLFRRKDFDESIAYRQKFKKIQNHIFEIKPSVV